MKHKGRVLFVDDEKRVLNSMRGMFRREYELFLTTEGKTAVAMAAENDVDVVVADQRMPGMSGVEVLEKVRRVSPRTIRILLTGYADPAAIQGSINHGEVFRFLSKPCPPAVLRETLDVAVAAANVDKSVAAEIPDLADARPSAAGDGKSGETANERTTGTPAASARRPTPAAAPRVDAGAGNVARQRERTTERDDAGSAGIRMRPETPSPGIATDSRPAADASGRRESTGEQTVPTGVDARDDGRIDNSRRMRLRAASVGVVVFTTDDEFADSVVEIIDPDRPVIIASSLGDVTAALEQRRAGIFLTDATEDSRFLQRLIGALKKHLPEVVTIVVSDSRDANDMIRLINYGQVYRYAVKPLEALTLRTDINAAVLKHLQLLNHPELVQRHQVEESSSAVDTSATLNRFIGKVSRLRELWAGNVGKFH